MPRRKSNKKKKDKKRSSGSSTPGSTPSVEDENQQLLKDGACGSSTDGHGSRSPHKTKGDDQKTSPRRLFSRRPGATCRLSSQAGHSSETELLIPPEQESDTHSPKSPSKPGLLETLRRISISPKKSSDSECGCTNKNDHQSECPELVKLAAQELERYKESSSESKRSSNSPNISRKVTDDAQTSSSDPSVAEHFKASKSQPPEKSLLSVPGKSPQRSPKKEKSKRNSSKSPVAKLRKYIASKRSPDRSSSGECSCEDKSNHDLNCPEQIKKTGAKPKHSKAKLPIVNQRKADESSSNSSSPSIAKKNKDVDEGNVSSKSSKSSSLTDPNALESSSSNDSKSNKASRNKHYFDPQEGTSSGPARVVCNKETTEQLPIERAYSHKTYLRIPSSEYQIPTDDCIKDELMRPLNASIQRISRPEDSPENDRKLLRLTATARPDASVRRQQSRSPVRLRSCNCGQTNRGTDHHVGCSRMIDVRARRKERRCRQDVRLPQDSPKERAVSLGSKGRYAKLESKGQDTDSQEDKKSESEDDEKSS